MLPPSSFIHTCLVWVKRRARLLGLLAFLLLLMALAHFSGLRGHFNLAYLRGILEGHPVLGLLAFVALFTFGNLIQLPGWLFLASAVLVLGPLWGGIVTYLAACVACALTFLFVRALGGAALRRLQSPLAQRLLARLDAQPIRSIVMLRILFQTLPALNYSLALSGLRFRAFAFGTLLGLPLPIALYCIFFEQLARLVGIAH
ncbi:MAG: VTT domain-containing protein [Brachymonas sp.]|nr:VTT domain-containing protein [Brachymonas sp.]